MPENTTTTTISPAVAADQDRLLSVKETQQRLNMCRSSIYKLMDDGRLKSLNIGRSRRIRLSDLVAFMSGAAS